MNIPEFVEFSFEWLNNHLNTSFSVQGQRQTIKSRLMELIHYLSQKYDTEVLKRILKRFIHSGQLSMYQVSSLQTQSRLQSVKRAQTESIREVFQYIFNDYITRYEPSIQSS